MRLATIDLGTNTVRLLIVGAGPERDALERYAQDMGLVEAAMFLGHRADVTDLLVAMELFILPSEAEDFGRVLLEAMATGRPVVATAAGGVPEVVEANVTGLLVEPADPHDVVRRTCAARCVRFLAMARAQPQ